MDGVYMSKLIKFVWSTALVLCLFLTGILLADKYWLKENVVRLRVVGASDSDLDQERKLKVRDAVTGYLAQKMKAADNAKEAKAFLATHLQELEEVATAVLCAGGCQDPVSVYLTKEGADTREYDTFRLPAGVYDTLRIDIGEAEGKNWWCVVFPSLCIPATTDGFRSEAVSAGFNRGLTESLADTDGFECRFFLLNCLGKIEKILFSR